jgi:hypothetical protein
MNKKHDITSLALMLDPKFKNMWFSITYVGCDVTLVLVAIYNKCLLLPLLVECYKFLMPSMFDEPLRQVAMDNEDLFSLTNTLKLVLWEFD